MRNSYSTQIFRADGKNTFVEVLNSSFPIGKVQFAFVEYDPQTNKQTKRLDIYIDALSAVALAEHILSGGFASMVERAKTSKSFNGAMVNNFTSYFIDMGGISEAKVDAHFNDYVARYPFLKKGQAISRQLKIQAGQKYPWVLRAEYGPGKSNETGLIVPQGNAPMCVQLPLDDATFRQMAVAIKYAYQAYLNQFYLKYADTLFPNDKINVFSKN